VKAQQEVKPMPRIALVLLVLSFAPATALAQEIPCREGPCVRKARPGTHFLAEINGGGTLLRDGGFAVDGLLGVGGKVPWLPLRLYAVGEFAYSTSYGHGRAGKTGLLFRDERDYRDLAAGLRLYVPLFAVLRLFGDALVGGSHQSVWLERDELPLREVSGWNMHAHVAAGLQYRLLYHMSIGVRAKVALTDPDLAGLHAAVGQRVPLRTSLTAGLTWHF